MRQLVELKIGSKRDLLDKELQVVNLQREMNGLENQLRIIGLTDAQVNQVMQGKRYDSLLTLRASIDGLVIERNATLGEIVAPDKPLFTIADLRRVIAEGDAFEPSLSFLQKGLAARVTVPAYPRQVFQGKITFVSFQVDPVKRTIHFWAEVPNTKDYRLRPNMFARISVIARSATKALAVPLNALLREGGQDFVFVDRDDRFLRTPVRLGASLQRAKADLARVRQLVELKIGSKRDLLDKELQVVNLQREMNGLENQLRIIGLTDAQVNQVMQGKRYDSLLTLRASIDGLVIERNATLGEIVAPDKPLFTIADLRRVIAEGDAFEPSLSFLQKGLAARVTVPAYPRQVFQGKITFVSFQVDPVKRTIHFWAEVPNTKDYRLRPNMFARISVIARSATKALAVPLNALLREGGQDFVFVDRDDRFLRTPVRLGARDDRMVEIKDGLFPGDRVVTDGKRQLYTLSRMGTSGGEALGGHGH